MKVKRTKLRQFEFEHANRTYTVNKRDDIWCIGLKGRVTTAEGMTLLDVLVQEFDEPTAADIVEAIVMLLVEEN